MVYDDIYEAKTAVDHLSGFNVANRYLIVLYYNTNKATKKVCALIWHIKIQTNLFHSSCCFSSRNDKHVQP